jgi:hypothetical protein
MLSVNFIQKEKKHLHVGIQKKIAGQQILAQDLIIF